MNKAEFVNAMAEQTGLSKKDSEAAINAFVHWIEKLSNKGFGQPYKSFLVNLDYVSGFSSDGKDIIMNNGEKIPLSKNFKKSFTNQYFANLHNIL